MAQLKFCFIITSGSGKLGGNIIQRTNAGVQLRSVNYRKSKPSASQYSIRRIMPLLQQAWQSITDTDRAAWNVFATRPLSGHSTFIQFNFHLLSDGQEIQRNPFVANGIPLGEEKIVNGQLASFTSWPTVLQFNITNGFAYFINSGTGRLEQANSFTSGIPYRVSFEIFNCPGVAAIRFTNNAGLDLFSVPLNGFNLYPNGIYSIDVSTIRDSVTFRLLAQAAGDLFNIRNLSVRQIL